MRANSKADIEKTLLVASMYVDTDDHRILGFLASWVSVHGGLVCVGKLRRLMTLEGIGDSQVISALAFVAVESRFHEWRPLAKKFSERELWKNAASARAREIKGVEPLLRQAGLLLPRGFLRVRSADILPIEKLSRAHRQARLRLIFGANLRADAIYYLSLGVKSASDLMRKIGCSYEPAHRVVKELRLAGTLELPRLHLP